LASGHGTEESSCSDKCVLSQLAELLRELLAAQFPVTKVCSFSCCGHARRVRAYRMTAAQRQADALRDCHPSSPIVRLKAGRLRLCAPIRVPISQVSQAICLLDGSRGSLAHKASASRVNRAHSTQRKAISASFSGRLRVAREICKLI